jgi:hypothetical protein
MLYRLSTRENWIALQLLEYLGYVDSEGPKHRDAKTATLSTSVLKATSAIAKTLSSIDA